MSPRIKALILAEGASLDALTNRLTAFNMLEEVLAPSFPAFLPKLAIIALYERGPTNRQSELYEQVTVLTPDGQVVTQTGMALTFAQPFHRSVHMLSLGLKGPGEHVVRVQSFADPEHKRPVKGMAAERTLMVTLRPAAPTAAGASANAALSRTAEPTKSPRRRRSRKA